MSPDYIGDGVYVRISPFSRSGARLRLVQRDFARAKLSFEKAHTLCVGKIVKGAGLLDPKAKVVSATKAGLRAVTDGHEFKNKIRNHYAK